MPSPFQITIDCRDADVMCAFWSTALGYAEEPPPAGYLSWDDFLRANNIAIPQPGSIGALVDLHDVGPRILFLRVPEDKVVKNRAHLDLRPGRNEQERLDKIYELTEAGATSIRRVDEHGRWWMVMADPEGNEFCVT